MTKWVYGFGDGAAEGGAGMTALLGGKGANLAEMSGLGLPVPPGFTITTEVCTANFDNDGRIPDGLEDQVAAALARVEALAGRRFGDPADPLLVSVRSGARASMPGMMDTVLNLGLNDETVQGLGRVSGDARFARDSYRRFIQMYGSVVLGIDHAHFEEILEMRKEDRQLSLDTELDADDWGFVVAAYLAKVEEDLGRPFPQDPWAQLWGAIGAVFGSWMNQRAVTYRRLHDIPADWGTAVNVQAMVFGNMGADGATGVAFTRNPSTGENVLYGEYLANAQGEDVVSGIRTPQELTVAGKRATGSKLPAMQEVMPEVLAELQDVRATLERHFRDMQDLEFTVQGGRLYMLQTRAGKRSAQAALKIAVDMVGEGVITEAEAVARIDPASLDQLLHPTLDPAGARQVIARGLPASPGAASGQAVFSADEAEDRAAKGDEVILVRDETSPEDIHGMHAAKGIVTSRGGMTSHAAVVARGMGRPCVVGALDIRVDRRARTLTAGAVTIADGEMLTIDGGTGEVMRGKVATIQPTLSGDFTTLMGWADAIRTLGVRANADTPDDARAAQLHETNPMLGHRGCRLGITYPEIYQMQARAIFEAVARVQEETGTAVEPEIMIPLIATRAELDILKALVIETAGAVEDQRGCRLGFLVGTMIELPRAVLMAGDIAAAAEFFSFGTNDLTQTAFGLSRDDAGRFLQAYERGGILKHDPFVTLDVDGVGELVRIGVERGRRTRPELKLGICGEHGGDPDSIHFCHAVGLDYVSCSPFRVPIARLAAAQAKLKADAA